MYLRTSWKKRIRQISVWTPFFLNYMPKTLMPHLCDTITILIVQRVKFTFHYSNVGEALSEIFI